MTLKETRDLVELLAVKDELIRQHELTRIASAAESNRSLIRIRELESELAELKRWADKDDTARAALHEELHRLKDLERQYIRAAYTREDVIIGLNQQTSQLTSKIELDAIKASQALCTVMAERDSLRGQLRSAAQDRDTFKGQAGVECEAKHLARREHALTKEELEDTHRSLLVVESQVTQLDNEAEQYKRQRDYHEKKRQEMSVSLRGVLSRLVRCQTQRDVLRDSNEELGRLLGKAQDDIIDVDSNLRQDSTRIDRLCKEKSELQSLLAATTEQRDALVDRVQDRDFLQKDRNKWLRLYQETQAAYPYSFPPSSTRYARDERDAARRELGCMRANVAQLEDEARRKNTCIRELHAQLSITTKQRDDFEDLVQEATTGLDALKVRLDAVMIDRLGERSLLDQMRDMQGLIATRDKEATQREITIEEETAMKWSSIREVRELKETIQKLHKREVELVRQCARDEESTSLLQDTLAAQDDRIAQLESADNAWGALTTRAQEREKEHAGELRILNAKVRVLARRNERLSQPNVEKETLKTCFDALALEVSGHFESAPVYWKAGSHINPDGTMNAPRPFVCIYCGARFYTRAYALDRELHEHDCTWVQLKEMFTQMERDRCTVGK